MEETQALSPQDILARLEEVTGHITEEIQGLDNAEVNFNSDVDEWSVKQIMAHLRDAEEIFNQRLHKILEEDEPFLRAFNPDELAAERSYQDDDWSQVVNAFQEARQNNLNLFRQLNPIHWNKAGIHQERGRFSIQEIGEYLVNHSEQHLEQIRHVSWLAK